MNHNVQAFRITQSTTQTFRDLYMHKTLLVLIVAGSKQLHPKTERSLIAQAGQLLVFPSGTFITLENRALSGSDYQADCICYPDDMVTEVFSQQRASIKIPSAIHIQHCPTGFASIVKGLGQIVSDSELPDEIKHHHLLEPLVWLKSMGVELFTVPAKPLDCQLRDFVASDVSKKWRSNEVASELGFSEATLRRKLKGLKTSFSTIVMDVRLEHGLTKLQSTQQPISQIALDCGFSTPSHFTDAFKSRFDIPPRVLRASIFNG